MTVRAARGDNPDDAYGRTDADMRQIHAFTRKRRYERCADDLRPISKQ